jgi:ribosomal protein L37E
MARTYLECPACGQRTLHIATRCPRCGHEFPTEPIRWQATRDSRRLPLVPVVVVSLLVAAGLIPLAVRRGADGAARVTADARAAQTVELETAQAAASPTVADSAPSAEAVRRQARTWTKVHERRSAKADVVAVLLPGDTVLADSLRGGWWRVALEGRVLGYVFAPTLVGD